MAKLLAGQWGSALLPEYVVLEVLTVLQARRDLSTASRVGSILLAAKEIEFVPCSDYFTDTLDVFRHQGATALSFADAAIVAITRRRAVQHVATFHAAFKNVPSLVVIP